MTVHRAPVRTVVLYNPRTVFWTMPLALVAVGSALDRERYRVIVVDGRLETDPIGAVLAALDESAVCVGMTVLTGAPIQDALAVTQAVRRARPGLPVVWGGWHPSLFSDQCVREARLAAAVVGQGERTFGEIVERAAARESLDGVAGCVHVRDTDVFVEAPREFLDVNTLPAHDYALLDVERYYTRKGRRQLDYISSQGCRFRCEFCADPYVYKRGWFGLEPARIGEELERLHRRHPFDDLNFQDETFFTSSRRATEIAEELLRRNIRCSWAATMRADQGVRLDEDALALCKRSGLRRAMVGVESGSQSMLDWMKKDIRLEQVFATADRLRAHGIGGLFPFIVGFPDEPEGSVRETMSVIKRLRAMSPDFEAVVYFYQPYPGSPIADLAWRRGYAQPQSLERWAAFDYVGARGPWVADDTWTRIQRFKFYQQHAFGRHRRVLHAPLQWLSRRRVDADRYDWPIEQMLLNLVRPEPKLS